MISIIIAVSYLILFIINVVLWQFHRNQSLIFASFELFIVEISIFLAFLIWSIVLIFRKWKVEKFHSVIPLMTLISINIIIFSLTPIIRIQYKQCYFSRNYSKYESLVSKISKEFSGDYKGFYKVPEKDYNISSDGKILVTKKGKDLNLIFYFTNTMFQSDGMLYSSSGKILDRYDYIKKQRTNWYYIQYD